MKERNDRIGSSMEYFDSCTDLDLVVTRSVEITNECPYQAPLFESVILDYAQSTTGILVRIMHISEAGDEITVVDPFELAHIDEVGMEASSFAEKCGLTTLELILIVQREAPHIDRMKQIKDFLTYSLFPDNQFDHNLKMADLTPAQLLA